MTNNQIDFTKPLEVVDYSDTDKVRDEYEVLLVIKHEYSNKMFKQAVVIKKGYELFIVAVTSDGYFSSSNMHFYSNLKLQNVKPKVTSETWVNLYKDGFAGCHNSNKKEADENARKSKFSFSNRYAYFVTKQYSDGTFTNEIIPISE